MLWKIDYLFASTKQSLRDEHYESQTNLARIADEVTCLAVYYQQGECVAYRWRISNGLDSAGEFDIELRKTYLLDDGSGLALYVAFDEPNLAFFMYHSSIWFISVSIDGGMMATVTALSPSQELI